MALWVIIPVKSFVLGKTRLAPILPEQLRITLIRSMFEKTIKIIKNLIPTENVIIVSKDPFVLDYSIKRKLQVIVEKSNDDINDAIKEVLCQKSFDEDDQFLIIPIDLPLLNTYDLQKLINTENLGKSIALVPDRHYLGSNLLLSNPINQFETHFGDNSFYNHYQEVLSTNSKIIIKELPYLGVDLDNVEDIKHLQEVYLYSITELFLI